MKKVINSKIFLCLIVGISCLGLGVYGANTYNSSSILYTTSDGKNMSVSDALNDLYGNTCSLANEEYYFDYTGSEQTFTVPMTGTYKLEVWGAQGGYGKSTTYRGGYGGYATGEIKLEEGTVLYVNVGGQGTNVVNNGDACRTGGYNGGGTTCSTKYKAQGSGGGATHIATKSGLLSSLENSVSDILIVAGGGAGGGYQTTSYYSTGGDGGGISGNDGTTNLPKYSIGTGGTQTSGGTSVQGTAKFGQGANCSSDCIGGGGGFYGGGSGAATSSGGGGSGYIGNSLLTNKFMYCYNCTTSDEIDTKTYSTTNIYSYPFSKYAKIGNGFAEITYLGK